MLDSKDLEFFDAIPLMEEEQHGQTGPNKNRHRPARTTMCDLKFLMMYIQDKVVAAGRFTDVILMASIADMFSVVATEFGGARNSQKKWHTISQEIRRSTYNGGNGENVILVYERRLQEQQELNDGQHMSGWWWGVMVLRMLAYVPLSRNI